VAQRSPHNPRYQKDAKVGSTRKSAASAKPKRGAGERKASESSKSSKSDSGKKKGFFSQTWTPEIGMWRRRSMFLLMAALAIAALGFIPAVQEFMQQYPFITWVGVGLYLVLLGGAIYIDWGIVRKLRNAELAKQRKDDKGGKGGKKS
jgi:hypothetical protein